VIPRWLQRRAERAGGVIDVAAARRVHARTAGWVAQRFARSSALAERYATTEDGASDELLLARAPAATAWPGDGDLPPPAEQDLPSPEQGSPPPASPLAARLQRRAIAPGVLDVRPRANLLGCADTAVSLKAGLHQRLAARTDAAGPVDTPLASIATHSASSAVQASHALSHAPIEPRIARTADPARAAVSNLPPSLAHPRGNRPQPDSMPRVQRQADSVASDPEPTPRAIAGDDSAHHEDRLQVEAASRSARVARAADPAPPDAAELALPLAQLAHRHGSRPQPDIPRLQRQADAAGRAAEQTPPAIAGQDGPHHEDRLQATELALPLARHFAKGVPDTPVRLQRVADSVPLTDVSATGESHALIRASESSIAAVWGAAPAAAPAAAPISVRQPIDKRVPIARTAELRPAAAPAAPTLVWRAGHAPAAQVARQAHALPQGPAIMRTTADDGADGGSTMPAGAASSAAPAAAALASAAAAPDIAELADQVSRVLARRLEVERERRGGTGWN
jgi:hypothetical protein